MSALTPEQLKRLAFDNAMQMVEAALSNERQHAQALERQLALQRQAKIDQEHDAGFEPEPECYGCGTQRVVLNADGLCFHCLRTANGLDELPPLTAKDYKNNIPYRSPDHGVTGNATVIPW